MIASFSRLFRFSKIGGEMVPHGAVEEALQQATGTDEAKGEQLAVCYTDKAGDPETLIQKLRNLGLPNLWIPRAVNFFRIPEMPLLGTGKLDLNSLKNRICAA